jgi:TetR/AcrR family tetracycline transcriptional repressor
MPSNRLNRNSPPGKPPISREMVVDAALKIVDQSGVDKLTMRSVADLLEVYPTTIYWHAGTKAELLAAVCERLLDGLELPLLSDGLEWDDWLEEVAHLIRAGLHEHPNVVPLMASQVQVSPSSFALADGFLGALSAAGFKPDQLVTMYNTVVGFIFGWVFSELAAPPSNADEGWEERFSGQLRDVDPDRYPHLHASVALLENKGFMLRAVSGRSAPMDESFHTALAVLIGGLRSLTPAPGRR